MKNRIKDLVLPTLSLGELLEELNKCLHDDPTLVVEADEDGYLHMFYVEEVAA